MSGEGNVLPSSIDYAPGHVWIYRGWTRETGHQFECTSCGAFCARSSRDTETWYLRDVGFKVLSESGREFKPHLWTTAPPEACR